MPWTRYWVVLARTLMSCMLLYELLVHRFTLLRVLFGMKARERATLSVQFGGRIPEFADRPTA